VVLGEALVFGRFKDSSLGYCIGTKPLIRNEEIIQKLINTNTQYDTPLMNETVIGGLILSGLYSYILYKVFRGMMDMHSYKGKEKLKDKKAADVKTFSDVGG
jgi:hypothetical protein